MGLFNRNKPNKIEEPIVEKRDNEQQESYTVPVGLDFLIPYLNKGEATAVATFFSGIQLISDTIASIPIHVRSIEDDSIIYHCGASINRIGYKTFSITLINDLDICNALIDKVNKIRKD